MVALGRQYRTQVAQPHATAMTQGHEDGRGRAEQLSLAVKPALDLIIFSAMTSSMGKDCAFSVIPVPLLEGRVTRCHASIHFEEHRICMLSSTCEGSKTRWRSEHG